MPAILAVAFASLLLLIQIALLLGLFATVTAVIDRSAADVWLTCPRLESFDQATDIPARAELALMARPEVAATEEVQLVNAQVRIAGGTMIAATVIGYPLGPKAFTMPASFRPVLEDALRAPDAVVIDQADAPKLDAEIGTVLEINGIRAPVVGFSRHFRGIGGVYIFTSLESARRFSGNGIQVPDMTTFVAARLHDPSRAEQVREAVQSPREDRTFDAWTSKDLSRHSQLYWLLETGMGVGVLFSALIGVVVGVVITSQTLRGIILASLKEYATLRAMGVPVASLRNIVLELAVWIGALGLAVTALVAVPLALLADKVNVSLSFPWWTIAATVVFTFSVSLASGVIALRVLYVAEPAELLRS